MALSVKTVQVVGPAARGSVHVVFCSVCSKVLDVLFHHVHCANFLFFYLFFQQIIPPGGNTSFDVVFLARVVGNVENTLFINTSHHGVFTYQVQVDINFILLGLR